MSAIHYMCACCLQRSEDGVGFPGTGTVDGWSFSVNVRPEYSESERSSLLSPLFGPKDKVLSESVFSFLWGIFIRSKTAGKYTMYIFNFIRTCQIVYQSAPTILYSHQNT